ncbi:MAG TPA: O-antigen ligase family protein [Pseudidiomarina sp.]|nr:O-antigen ligase family protein [Pseudidiomarina sp.]
MIISLNRSQLARLLTIALIFPIIWLDSLYGILSYVGLDVVRVSLAFRMLLLALGLVLIYTQRGLLPSLLKSIILLWLLLLLIQSYPVGDTGFFSDLNIFLRWIYPFVITLLALYIYREYGVVEQLSEKGIAHFGWVFGAFMVFSFASGIGLDSYGDHAFGIKSFYVGGNDVGLAALISLCVLAAFFYEQLSWSSAGKLLLCFSGLTLLGTKAGWIGAAIILSVFFALYLLFKRSVTLQQRVAKTIVAIMLSVVVVSVSSFVHKNYELFEYQLTQIGQIMEGANPRALLVLAGERELQQHDKQADLVGLGERFYLGSGREHYLISNNSRVFDTYLIIEQDWYDLRGAFGVPFALFMSAMHLFFWFAAIALFFRQPTIRHFSFILALTIYLGHGYAAGHAFMGTQPSSLVGIIYALIVVQWQRLRQATPTAVQQTASQQRSGAVGH